MDTDLGGSFAGGLFTGSWLLVGTLLAFWVPMSRRVVGLTLAFGSGVVISAVAFGLVGPRPSCRRRRTWGRGYRQQHGDAPA